MLHIRPEAADPGLDQIAGFGMRADGARQGQQIKRAFQRQAVGRPALGQAGPVGLGIFRRRLAPLDIRPEAAGADRDRVAVLILTQNLAISRQRARILGNRDRAGIAAFGIIAAADEGPAGPRRLQMQPAGAAGWADARITAVRPGRVQMGRQKIVDLFQHFRDAQLGRFGHRSGKVAPEAPQHIQIGAVAGRNVIQFRLKIGGEVIFDIAVEEVRQKGRDQPPLVFGDQAVLFLADIFAVLDRGDDRGVGGRAADAQLFHPLDQRGLGVAGGRLGEMLAGRHAALVYRLSLHQLRQAAFVFVLIVAALVIDLEETVEQHDLPRRAQGDLTVGAGDIDRRAFQPRRRHLAGDGALPDQVIKPRLIAVGQPQLFGRRRHVGRADAFVGFLRVLGLVLVHPRGFRDVSGAKAAADFVARGHDRLGRHVDAVGPHIGDVAGLIQPLRRLHRHLGAHAELAAGLLLKGRGHEGREGVAAGGLRFHRRNRQGSGSDSLHGDFGRCGGRNVEFLQFAAAQNGKLRLKLLPARGDQQGFDRPVFLGTEGLDLHLAFDDQTQHDRLHPPGRPRARQLAPEDGRQGKAHQIVQRAAGEIGLDQRLIHLTGFGHRLGHGGFCDGVEGDAADLLSLLQAGGQRLLQVPGNRLALAVGVGGKDQFVIGLQRLGNRLHMLAAFGRDFPGHQEIMLGIDRAVLGRQVADMAVRGENRVVRPEILVDRLGLGRGLDNDDGHGNSFERAFGRRGTMWGKRAACQPGRGRSVKGGGKAAQDGGVKPVLLGQNAGGKAFGRVMRQNRHPRLPQNRAGIQFGRHLMHGAAGFRIARVDGALMGVQAGIFRQKRRVDVQHPAFEAADEGGRQDAHEARKAENVGLGCHQGLQQRGLKPRAVAAEGPVIDGSHRHAQCSRSFQPLGRRIVRQNQHRPGRMIARHVAHQRQHVRATPGNQDGDTFHKSCPR